MNDNNNEFLGENELLETTTAQEVNAFAGGESHDEQPPKKQPSFKKGFILGMLCMLAIAVIAIAVVVGINYYRAYQYRQKMQSNTTQSESADASGDVSNVVSELTLSNTLTETNLSKLNYLYALINKYYYEDVNVDDLMDGVFAGVINGLNDKYSTYYTAKEYQSIQAKNTGSYGGIGALFGMSTDTGYPTVLFVYDDTPAKDAGLQADDYVISVGDEDISGMELDEVVSLIRGKEGTDVTLTYVRGGQAYTVTMTRKELELTTVSGQMLDDGIGYIQITSFSSNTGEQFKQYADEFLDEGMTSLIVDLRNNGGGVIDGAADVLDYLLPEGTVVYTMEESDNKRTDYTSDEENQLDIPLVVLINGNSASASEIFAAAIRDFDWGTLVGTTTYGKGVYQTSMQLSDGSAVKLTSGKFYSPKGYNFNGVGIDPDVEIEYKNLDGDDADYSLDVDNQVQKAIEILKKQQ